MKSVIYTISREYGSGGREVGCLLAKQLNIPFYDRTLIELASIKSGLNTEYIENAEQLQHDENSLFKMAVKGIGALSLYGYSSVKQQEELFITQEEIIKEIAAKGPCVIVGRCADVILKERTDCINIFIYSDIQSRAKRAVEKYGRSPKNIERKLHERDQARSSYYSRFTSHKWGTRANYHLMLHSDRVGISKCVKILQDYMAE